MWSRPFRSPCTPSVNLPTCFYSGLKALTLSLKSTRPSGRALHAGRSARTPCLARLIHLWKRRIPPEMTTFVQVYRVSQPSASPYNYASSLSLRRKSRSGTSVGWCPTNQPDYPQYPRSFNKQLMPQKLHPHQRWRLCRGEEAVRNRGARSFAQNIHLLPSSRNLALSLLLTFPSYWRQNSFILTGPGWR